MKLVLAINLRIKSFQLYETQFCLMPDWNNSITLLFDATAIFTFLKTNPM